MTQKHFIAAADQIIANHKYWESNHSSRACKAMIREIMTLCSDLGPRFDLDKFKSYLKKHGVDYDAMPNG